MGAVRGRIPAAPLGGGPAFWTKVTFEDILAGTELGTATDLVLSPGQNGASVHVHTPPAATVRNFMVKMPLLGSGWTAGFPVAVRMEAIENAVASASDVISATMGTTSTADVSTFAGVISRDATSPFTVEYKTFVNVRDATKAEIDQNYSANFRLPANGAPYAIVLSAGCINVRDVSADRWARSSLLKLDGSPIFSGGDTASKLLTGPGGSLATDVPAIYISANPDSVDFDVTFWYGAPGPAAFTAGPP